MKETRELLGVEKLFYLLSLSGIFAFFSLILLSLLPFFCTESSAGCSHTIDVISTRGYIEVVVGGFGYGAE